MIIASSFPSPTALTFCIFCVAGANGKITRNHRTGMSIITCQMIPTAVTNQTQIWWSEETKSNPPETDLLNDWLNSSSVILYTVQVRDMRTSWTHLECVWNAFVHVYQSASVFTDVISECDHVFAFPERVGFCFLCFAVLYSLLEKKGNLHLSLQNTRGDHDTGFNRIYCWFRYSKKLMWTTASNKLKAESPDLNKE